MLGSDNAVAEVFTSFSAAEKVPIEDTDQNDTFRDTDLSQQSEARAPYTRSAFGYRSYTTSADVGLSCSTIQYHTTRSLIVAINESRILTWQD